MQVGAQVMLHWYYLPTLVGSQFQVRFFTQSLYCYRIWKKLLHKEMLWNLSTAFINFDASYVQYWDECHCIMVWDCAFIWATFSGIITYWLHLRDTWMKLMKRMCMTPPKKNTLRNIFKVLERECVPIMMIGGTGSDGLVIWLLQKKLSKFIKELKQSGENSIVKQAKDQLVGNNVARFDCLHKMLCLWRVEWEDKVQDQKARLKDLLFQTGRLHPNTQR